MMDIQEATNTLNARSALIVSKTVLYKKLQATCTPEEAKKLQAFIALLNTDTKNAEVLSCIILKEIIQDHTRLVLSAPVELANLWIAIERNRKATTEAKEFTTASEEKLRPQEPQESPSATAIRQFRESRYSSAPRP